MSWLRWLPRLLGRRLVGGTILRSPRAYGGGTATTSGCVRCSNGSPKSRSRRDWSGHTAGSSPSLPSAGSWRSQEVPWWLHLEPAISVPAWDWLVAPVPAGVREAAGSGGHEFPFVTVVVELQYEHAERAVVTHLAAGSRTVEAQEALAS